MSATFPGVPDGQNSADTRRIDIDRVGVKSIRYPIKVWDQSARIQHTVAVFNMCVALPHHFKGTHMSRCLEILNGREDEISVADFPAMLRDMVVKPGPQGRGPVDHSVSLLQENFRAGRP